MTGLIVWLIGGVILGGMTAFLFLMIPASDIDWPSIIGLSLFVFLTWPVVLPISIAIEVIGWLYRFLCSIFSAPLEKG